MDSSQVIIVGGGPVGLVTALGLARAGIEVTVLDKDVAVGAAPRAMAYLYAVLDGFDHLDLLEDLERAGFRVDGLNFVDYQTGEQFAHTMAPVADILPHPYTLHLGQDQVSRILLAALAEHENVSIRYRAELAAVTHNGEEGVRATLMTPSGTETLAGAWLVGADGANSATRRSLGLDFAGFTWPDRFVAANIRHDFEAQGLTTANCQIDAEFGAIIAKITTDGLWRYAYREPADLPAASLAERVPEHLAKALPEGGEPEIVAYSPYRVHQRAAHSFRVGRVMLAGDAAHVTNPTGGLGLVSGFLDAFVLSEALAAVARGKADEAVLDAYAAERRRVFLDVVSPMAIRNKTRLFDPPSGQERVKMLDGLRHLAADADARREEILALRALVTPSLLPKS